MTPPRTEPMTLRAVLDYQKKLELRAELQIARNPYAKPYSPKEEAAKRLFYGHLATIKRRDTEAIMAAQVAGEPVPIIDDLAQRGEAAALAVQTLAGRARVREREQQQEDQRSVRSLERLQRDRARAERDRQQQRNGLTVGQRLDRALAAFSVIPGASAAPIGWSTKGSDRPELAKHGDPSGEAHYVAIKAVREIEDLLDRHRLRDVSKAA